MEFDEEKQYLTYDEYLDLGGQLDETPFDLLEFEARRRIDARTNNRLKNMVHDEIPQEVKMCVFKMITIMTTYDKSVSNIDKGLISETTDSYSVSFINSSQFSQILTAKGQDLENCMLDYLTGVIVNNEHILYLGRREC